MTSLPWLHKREIVTRPFVVVLVNPLMSFVLLWVRMTFPKMLLHLPRLVSFWKFSINFVHVVILLDVVFLCFCSQGFTILSLSFYLHFAVRTMCCLPPWQYLSQKVVCPASAFLSVRSSWTDLDPITWLLWSKSALFCEPCRRIFKLVILTKLLTPLLKLDFSWYRMIFKPC